MKNCVPLTQTVSKISDLWDINNSLEDKRRQEIRNPFFLIHYQMLFKNKQTFAAKLYCLLW